MRKGLTSVAKLVSGTALAQVMALAAAPLLSRLFTPDQFGVVGVFLSFATVVGAVSALRLELAVVVARTDDGAVDVVGVALWVLMCVVTLSALVVLFGSGALAGWLGEPQLGSMLAALPLYVASVGVFQVLNYWSTRLGHFGDLATAHVGRGAVTAATQIAAGLTRLGAPGLLAGHVLGQAAGAMMLLRKAFVGNAEMLRRKVAPTKVLATLREYKDFALYGSLQALLNAAGQGVPAVFLAAYFDAATAGQYLLAQRMITAPSRLVGQSVRQVVYPALSRIVNERRVTRVALGITIALTGVALIPLIVLAGWGPGLFAWVFGAEWRQAGEFARFTVLLLVVGLVNIPAVSLIPIIRMQRWHAAFEVVYMVARVAALMAGGYLYGPLGAVAGISLASLLFNLILMVIVFWRLRLHLEALRQR